MKIRSITGVQYAGTDDMHFHGASYAGTRVVSLYRNGDALVAIGSQTGPRRASFKSHEDAIRWVVTGVSPPYHTQEANLRWPEESEGTS